MRGLDGREPSVWNGAWSANDSSTPRRGLLLAAVPVAGAMTYLSDWRAGVAGAALAGGGGGHAQPPPQELLSAIQASRR